MKRIPKDIAHKNQSPSDKTHVSPPAESRQAASSEAGVQTVALEQGGFFVHIKPILFALLLFFAMTVQTGRAALIFAALAFVSMIGRKPLARFGKRLGLPVLGLLAFAVMYGAAAIYSPFGANAMAELYKFLTAFSLSVILLARYDKEDVPGLMWGGSAVSAVIGLLCVDMECAGRTLFAPFNALMNWLGADYASALAEYASSRVNGLYNDANVSAALFSVAAILSLYLLKREACRWKRLAAAILAAVNSIGILISGSRGALLCFAAACLVWLVAERADRIGLFLLLAAAAVVTVGFGVPVSSLYFHGSELSLLVMLAGGGVLFVLDLLCRPLSGVLSAHRKAALAFAAVLCVVVLGAGAAMVLHTGPYTFYEDGQEMTWLLPQDTAGDVTLSGDGDEDFQTLVYSQTLLERYGNSSVTLYDGPLSQCAFTVPEDAVEVHIRLIGNAGESLRSLTVSGAKAVTVNYPWLPEVISTRLLNDRLLGGNSSFMREEYVRDTLKLFAEKPVFGHGLGSTENLTRSVQRFAYASKYAHNHLLQTLSDTGVVGAVCALAFMLGTAWLCLRAVLKEKDALAAALLAAWVMLNLHSLMEINFSVRAFRCFAYVTLLLPVLLWAEQPEGETVKVQKQAKIAGILMAVLYALYLAVFGGLLESARMVDRQAENFQTSDVTEYLSTLQGYVSRNVFDHDYYARSYVALAVQLNDTRLNGVMLKYVDALRASGTYENDSALARYYYLPRAKWDDLFDCSLEGIRQVRSSPDGWNYQMDFYRTEVLPAMGTDNMDAFVDGVLALGDALDGMNNEGRLETVALNEENQAFLTLCRSVKEQGLTGTDAYAVLSLSAQSGDAAQ